ncbi:putative oxidoreductase [Paenibacillus shirakamiensis]|uniref:Oxidoreductase n=1 Tax=Paenibacillus shirakamiensis TaxID=1265935 RepID=A0ABS4JMH9_9BACL|nr:DoxX family protein [Paenibacillus shirakamiensis]MBP2001809.1 putative oxidoreductase [Paenibacillus shirakamiensis]
MADWGLLLIRLVVGLIFAAHGAQKVFGWFGGHGLKNTAGFFESMNIRPSLAIALASGLFEILGGLLFATGFWLPLGAAMIIITMIGAIVTVHGKNGLWATSNGYELNLLYIVTALGVALIGPGTFSL